MIRQPRKGQRVRIHYAKRYASIMPYHGKEGVVTAVSGGPGPINAEVEINGEKVIVPRGNLLLLDKPKDKRALF